MNILAIGAHPDDVEIFCGGTLLKYKKQGHQIFIVLTTSGNIGSNEYNDRETIAAIREKEQLEAAKLYSAEVKFLRNNDQGLFDTPENRRALISAIRWADPDIIFTEAPWDPSTDHAMTGKMVSEVLLSLPGKLVPADVPPIKKAPSLFYWDTSAGINFSPEAYVDITEFMDLKKEAIGLHKSQMSWMDVFIHEDFGEHCAVLSRFRGLQANCRYAEAFIGHKISGYFADYRLLP